MTKQKKVFRQVICVLVSFILSLSIALMLVFVGIKFTALNPSYAIYISQKSDYAELLHKEIKEKYISYGNACNVDEIFFDSVFSEIITVEQIDKDTQTVLNDFYENNIKASIDTTEVDAEMLSALEEYAVSKGYNLNDSMNDSLKVMVEEMSQLYNAYISMFSSSYFQAASGMLSRYMPYVNYAIYGMMAMAIISCVIIRLSYKKAKNYLRYYIYAGSGATLMLSVAPLTMIFMRVGSKINIANPSLYGFASGFINYIFFTIILLAIIVAVITGIIIALRNRSVKLNR